MDYKIFWSEEALLNFEDILHYLAFTWSEREINNFKKLLNQRIEFIKQNPYIFPKSPYNPSLRKAVINKQTSVYYKIENQIVYLAYLFVNRKNIDRIK